MNKSLKEKNREKLLSSQTFCAKPFEHMFISNQGKQLPCCRARYTDENSLIDSKSMELLWNSEYLKSIRKHMIEGKRAQPCTVCYEKEDIGMKSSRQKKLIFSEPHDLNLKADGSLNLNVKSLDARVGSKCNIACRMCIPRSSYLLANEWKSSPIKRMRIVAQETSEMGIIDNSEDIKQILANEELELNHIHLAGGEPMLFLGKDSIFNDVSVEKLNKIELSLNTNLTLLPQSFLEKVKNFKLVKISASMDGYGKLNNYIRYPSKWESICKNLDILKMYAQSSDHLRIFSCITIQLYNVLSLAPLLEYLLSKDFSGEDINFNILDQPHYLNVRNLPIDAKQEACVRLEKFVRDSPAMDLVLSNKIKHLLSYINSDGENKNHSLSLFKVFTKYFDQTRGESIEKACPDLYSFVYSTSEGP